jgi:hypothetical protein
MLRVRATIPSVNVFYRPTEQQLATTVATTIGLPGEVRAVADGTSFLIIATLDVANAPECHRDGAHSVLGALEQAGLRATRLVATRTATRLAEGAVTGLAGGLGLGSKVRTDLAPLLTLASTAVGGFIGNLVEKELDLFEWQRGPDGGWYLVTTSSSNN